MRRIVVTEFVSLDGVMEEPRWTFQFERGPDGAKFKFDELFDSEALLLGRVTYQGFAQAWPSMGTDDFGKRMNSIRKYVVSSTLTDAEATWGETTVIRGDVATEIAKRFYLTIGFVTLLMLVALAVTSTDGWQKRLRRNWKRLHWLIYPAAFIALVHFFIQSKVKIGEPAFAAGLFAWLMLWRVLPVKLRTRFTGLALLAGSATLAAVLFEAAWYGLVNGIDPVRVLMANLDIDFDLALRPAHKVLIASLLVMLAVALRRLALVANKLWTRRYMQSTIPAP